MSFEGWDTKEAVVKEFEHCLKVYMSDIYENALDNEKDRVITKI